MKNKKGKIIGFITVRTTSTRLPKKCLLPFGESTVLNHIIRRAIWYGIEPIVCTSIDPEDDVIEQVAADEKVKCFRGLLQNKLKRWADCAEYFDIDMFHTIDADDPFFDGEEMKKSMRLLSAENIDMVYPTESSSSGGASVGYSLTTDIVKQACSNLSEETDTEMMWSYIEKISNLKSKILTEERKFIPKMRLTLDYEEDYWLLESVRRIVGNLADRSKIDDLFIKNPDLYKINWFRNEEWKAGQLSKII